MSKKKLLSLSLVVIMVAILSFGTLAWFNDADSVTNEFYVADSDGDGMPDFTIDVKEQKVDENGNPVVDDEGNPVYDEDDLGNDYKNIIAGDQLDKYVVVDNTGEYDQWVRVHFTFTDSAVWQQAMKKAADAAGMSNVNAYVLTQIIPIVKQTDNFKEWEVNYNVYGADTITYTLNYSKTLAPDDDPVVVLEHVNIPGVLEQEDMNFGADGMPGFALIVKAEAVQVDNLEANSAKEAFEEVGWEIGTEYGA